MKLFAKDTGDLFEELKKEKNLQNYSRRNENEFLIPLHEYLEKLMEEKNLELNDVINACNLSRVYAYQIFNGTKKNPSREKILAIGFAMDLDLNEMQNLLKNARQNLLYPRNFWDSVIISALEQKLNILETNELLAEVGEEIFLE